MDENIATINISLRDGTIQISGSEDFVSAHLAIFKNVIIQGFSKMEMLENKQENQIDNNPPKKGENEYTSLPTQYDLIFSYDGEDLSLLIDKAPGSNNQEKTVNLALLYLFGKSLKGVDEISTDEIRLICENYACLDSGNFMKHLKKAKKDILLKQDSGRKYSAKLSAPGKIEAKALIDSLQIKPS